MKVSPLSGSVAERVPMVAPAAFSAKVAALKATALGVSLTLVTVMVKSLATVLLAKSVAVIVIE